MPGFVLEPQGGAAFGFHGSRVLIKASGDDTLGQLAVLESVYPPGLSVHVHIHEGEDEMFYVLSGELTGTCGDVTWTAQPGSFVFVPRDTPHSLTVTSAGAGHRSGHHRTAAARPADCRSRRARARSDEAKETRTIEGAGLITARWSHCAGRSGPGSAGKGMPDSRRARTVPQRRRGGGLY